VRFLYRLLLGPRGEMLRPQLSRFRPVTSRRSAAAIDVSAGVTTNPSARRTGADRGHERSVVPPTISGAVTAMSPRQFQKRIRYKKRGACSYRRTVMPQSVGFGTSVTKRRTHNSVRELRAALGVPPARDTGGGMRQTNLTKEKARPALGRVRPNRYRD